MDLPFVLLCGCVLMVWGCIAALLIEHPILLGDAELVPFLVLCAFFACFALYMAAYAAGLLIFPRRNHRPRQPMLDSDFTC